MDKVNDIISILADYHHLTSIFKDGDDKPGWYI
jgi:hypothetical protein